MSFLTLTAEAYHRDELGDDGPPCLSASIATIMLTRSPAHAKAAHPRLNPDYQPVVDKKFDLGTVAHQMLLEGNESVCIVEEESWRTKAAKEAADWARVNSLTPLLREQYDNAHAMVDAARVQIAGLAVEPLPFTDGKPEVTIAWNEPNGVACKARLDWLHDDHVTIDDLKTTSRSASHQEFSRTLYSMLYHVKAAFYRRGIERLTGRVPEFRFVALETQPPYGLTIHSLTPAGYALGDAQVDRAVALWAECLAANEWPGYDGRLAYAEPPAWAEAQWLEREAREEVAA